MNKGIAVHTMVSSNVHEEEGSSQGKKDNSRDGYIGGGFWQSSNDQQAIRRKSGKVKHNHVTPSSMDWSFPIW